MNDDTKTEQVTRDRILKLLSDEEVARVSMVEDGTSLAPGDEYIDLEALEEGVHRAAGSVMAMARVLPRKSVQIGTWDKIVAWLPVHASPKS